MKPCFIKCKCETDPDGDCNPNINMNLVTCFKRYLGEGCFGIRFHFVQTLDKTDWYYSSEEERDIEYMRLLNEFCV